MKQIYFPALILFIVSLPCTAQDFTNLKTPDNILKDYSGSDTSQAFLKNRSRVFETLSNLPIDRADWRAEDIANKYIQKWKQSITNSVILFTNESSLTHTECNTIYINPYQFDLSNTENRVIEHELTHAAFCDAIPDWMIWLASYSIEDKKKICMYNLPERVTQAVVARRDIIDYLNLPLTQALTVQHIEQYIKDKGAIGLDAGMKEIVSSTTPESIIRLLNFVNPYEADWAIKN